MGAKAHNKQGNFTVESYHFEETTCNVMLDFSKVFITI